MVKNVEAQFSKKLHSKRNHSTFYSGRGMTTDSHNSRSSELIKKLFIIYIFLCIYLDCLFHICVPVRNPNFEMFFPTLLLIKSYTKTCILPFLASLRTQIPRICSVL